MQVSVTLHTEAPPEDGNQRQFEARYRGFNRRFCELTIEPETGYATFEARGVNFPTVQADPDGLLTHFSLGVCIAPPCQGGAIIIVGPLNQPILTANLVTPRLSFIAGVVTRKKLEKLGLIKLEAGRFVERSERELTGA